MKKLMLPLVVFALLVGCTPKKQNTPVKQIQTYMANRVAIDNDKLLASAQGYFGTLPEAGSFENIKAQLGKKLYYETALSINGKMNCNSCHMLDKYGVDNESTSPGHEGKRGDRNSPTVYNAYLHVAQFWDGRAKDLAAQAKGPILNPVEMGIPDEATAVKNIKETPGYRDLFAKAYSGADPITYNNIADAIAEFEKTLATPSKFDNYLAGNANALNPMEKQGLNNFINAGCITCHAGPGLGGNMYRKFGLINGPYWNYTDSEGHDEGRFTLTGNEGEKQVFKVPSLRNIDKTYPYFHDGSVATLERVVKIMGVTQLDKEFSNKEIESIVAFLKTLTGDIPVHALQTENLASL